MRVSGSGWISLSLSLSFLSFLPPLAAALGVVGCDDEKRQGAQRGGRGRGVHPVRCAHADDERAMWALS
eukprot:4771467-Prymnesium_polylepis.1